MGLLEVIFLEQEMNFRIVKKPLEFIVKSRTTSDEVKKWILEKKKGPSEDKISPVVVLYIVSTVGLRKALRVILGSDHFSDQNTQIFPGPVDARFPVIPNYS